MTLRRTFASLLAVALVLPTGSALAQRKGKKDPAQEEKERKEREAYDLYQQGITHYNLGEFDQAIEKFKAAYALTGATGLLFNIAQSYRLKKDYEQALYFYKTYLRLEPDAPNKADVDQRIAEMEKLLAEQKKLDGAKPVGTIPPGGSGVPDGGGQTGGGQTGDTGGGQTGNAGGGDQGGTGGGTQVATGGGGDGGGGSAVSGGGVVGTVQRGGGAFGVHLRADVDTATFSGAAFAIGADYAVSPSLELSGGVLVSYAFGAALGLTYLFGDGSLRPLVAVEVPMFFDDGVHVGAHPSGGVRLGLGPNLALQAELGIAYFFSTPDRIDVEGNEFSSFYVVPSVGVQGRF